MRATRAAVALAAAVFIALTSTHASAATLSFPTAQGWLNPTAATSYKDWSFGRCDGSYTPGLAHLGADDQGGRSTPAGSSVKAIADGTIVSRANWGTKWGWAVGVRHESSGGPFLAVYGHVRDVGSAAIGRRLRAGDGLAKLYDLGSNSHLHLGVRPLSPSANAAAIALRGSTACPSAPTYEYVNPLPWLEKQRPLSRIQSDIEVDGSGAVWLAGLRKDGTLLTRSKPAGGAWSGYSQHGSNGTWGAVDIEVGPTGDVWLAGLRKDGTLLTRSRTAGAWSGYSQHGSKGTWGAVDIEVGPTGDVWLAGLRKDGTLQTRSKPAGSGWTGYSGHSTAKSWAGADLEIGPAGEVWYAGLKKDGSLYTRNRSTAGAWSGYSQHGSKGTWQ